MDASLDQKPGNSIFPIYRTLERAFSFGNVLLPAGMKETFRI